MPIGKEITKNTIKSKPLITQYALAFIALLLVALAAQAQTRLPQLRMNYDYERQQAIRRLSPNAPYTIASSNADSAVTSAAPADASRANQLNGRMPTNSQWQQLAGPETGNIYSLLVKGNRVFAGTNGGIYYSDDEGRTWSRSLGSQAIQSSATIVNIGDSIFYGSDAFGTAQDNQGGVWRSNDNGISWDHVTNGLPENSSIYYLSTVQRTLLVTVFGGGIYRSTDNGDTWTLATNGIAEGLRNAETANNSRVILAITNVGVYRSTDNASTWSDISANLPTGVSINPFRVPIVMGNTFLVSAGTSGVLLSDDDGTTWRSGNQGLPANVAVVAIFQSGNDMFAELSDGSLYFSNNRAASWTKRSNDFAIGRAVNTWAKIGDTNIAGTGEAVFRSEDGGATWERSMSGMRVAYNDGGFIAVGNRLYLGAASGIWASDNKGASWRLLNNGFRRAPVTNITGGGICEQNGWLIAGSFFDGLYRSGDGGNSWTRLEKGLPDSISTFVIKSINHKLYVNDAFGDGSLLVSNDDGETWEKINNFNPGFVFALTSLGNGRLLLGTYGGGIFRSDDDGKTWRAFNTGIQNDFIDDFNVYRNVILAGTDDGVYRLADDESAWVKLPNYAESIKGGVNFFGRVGKTLFASTFGRGIAVSYNNGETWGKYNFGLNTLRGFHLVELDNDLYFGSAGAGIWVLRNPPKASGPF